MIARYRGGSLRAVPSTGSEVKAVLEPLAADVAARLDVFDITGALERVWEVVRWLNRHVEVTAPWQLAKDESRAAELDRVLYDLADGIRAVAVALASYIPPTADRILAALGQPQDVAWENVAYGRTVEVTGIEAAAPLFPRLDAPTAGVIDTHAHLDACDDPAAMLARAQAAGVTRIVTIGTGIDSCRAALAIAEQHEGVLRRARDRPPSGRFGRGAADRRAPRAAQPSEGGRRRRDRARQLPPLRHTCRATRAVRRAARARRGAREAGRDPQPRRKRGHGRCSGQL